MREHFVASISDFPASGCVVVQCGGVEVGVVRVGDAYHAYENYCPHQGGPVCQGKVFPKLEAVLAEDRTLVCERWSETEKHIVCPWHGWEFSAETGAAVGDPTYRLSRHPILVRDGAVYVLADE